MIRFFKKKHDGITVAIPKAAGNKTLQMDGKINNTQDNNKQNPQSK